MSSAVVVVILAFTGLVLQWTLAPSLSKCWKGGVQSDATSKQKPFVFFLFGGGTSDGRVCLVNSDSDDARTQTVEPTNVYDQYTNTVESCTGACGSLGYSIAGVEFGL